MVSQNMSRVRRDSVRISSFQRTGYHAAPDHIPSVGDVVYCVEGEATVVEVLGRIGDGSRLLELHLTDRPKPSFFAASSNVLVRDSAD